MTDASVSWQDLAEQFGEMVEKQNETIDTLKGVIETQAETIRSQSGLLEAKDETIRLLNERVALLKQQLVEFRDIGERIDRLQRTRLVELQITEDERMA